MSQKPYLFFYERVSLLPALLKWVAPNHPWGTMLSWLLKEIKVAFNNQESIVPQWCFGAPHL